jgi:serine protease Do
LKKSRDFLAGNLDEDAFVAYLVRAFQTSGSQPTRLPQAAAARMEPETSVRPTGPRGMLGVIIQNISPDFKDQFNLSSTNGALVAQINKNSAAERAGVKIGDIIIRFNDKEVEDVSSLRNAVASTAPGARATVVVIRDRRERTLTAQLDELKIEEGRERAKPTEGEAFAAVLGIYVEPLTAEAIKYYRFDETDQGALVRFVDNESPATTAGLFPGDLITEVNREKVANPADFHSALQKTKTKESILLLVTRDKANRFVIIKPKQDK